MLYCTVLQSIWIREGIKKKLVEFSTKGGGGGEGQDQSIFH